MSTILNLYESYSNGKQIPDPQDHHIEDAEVAKKQSQMGRYHASMAAYHKSMAAQHQSVGDKEKHAQSMAAHDFHQKKSEEAYQQERLSSVPSFKNKEYDFQGQRRSSFDTEPMQRERPKPVAKKQEQFRQYFHVPYKDKDSAKSKGYKQDPKEKKQYVRSAVRDVLDNDQPHSHTNRES